MAGNQPRRNNANKAQKKANRRLRRQATREVNISYRPQEQGIQRQLDQYNLDYQNKDQGIQSIYGGLNPFLENLNDRYSKATGDIASDLQSQLAQFSGALNQQGLPTNELAANTALYGQYGNNAFNTLASDAQRQMGYTTSAQREGELSERYARQNLMQDLSDQQQQLYNRQADIDANKSVDIRSQMDQLRQDQAYNDLIAQLTGNALDSGGPGPGHGGPGPGNPGPPHGQTSSGGQYSGPSHAAIDNQGMGGAGNRVAQLDAVNEYSDLPPWLQQFLYQYPQGGPAAWRGSQSLGPRRRRIWRMSDRQHLRDLYNQSHPGGSSSGFTEPGPSNIDWWADQGVWNSGPR